MLPSPIETSLDDTLNGNPHLHHHTSPIPLVPFCSAFILHTICHAIYLIYLLPPPTKKKCKPHEGKDFVVSPGLKQCLIYRRWSIVFVEKMKWLPGKKLNCSWRGKFLSEIRGKVVFIYGVASFVITCSTVPDFPNLLFVYALSSFPLQFSNFWGFSPCS